MEMIIGMKKIKFLSGMMGIKKEGPKSKNKRRFNAHCLAPIKAVGLVYS